MLLLNISGDSFNMFSPLIFLKAVVTLSEQFQFVYILYRTENGKIPKCSATAVAPPLWVKGRGFVSMVTYVSQWGWELCQRFSQGLMTEQMLATELSLDIWLQANFSLFTFNWRLIAMLCWFWHTSTWINIGVHIFLFLKWIFKKQCIHILSSSFL